MNYVKLLRKDTGIEEAAEIKTAMMDREGWRDRARRTSGPPTGTHNQLCSFTSITEVFHEKVGFLHSKN